METVASFHITNSRDTSHFHVAHLIIIRRSRNILPTFASARLLSKRPNSVQTPGIAFSFLSWTRFMEKPSWSWIFGNVNISEQYIFYLLTNAPELIAGARKTYNLDKKMFGETADSERSPNPSLPFWAKRAKQVILSRADTSKNVSPWPPNSIWNERHELMSNLPNLESFYLMQCFYN